MVADTDFTEETNHSASPVSVQEVFITVLENKCIRRAVL